MFMQDHFPPTTHGAKLAVCDKEAKPTIITLPKELDPRIKYWIKREDLHFLGSHKHFGVELQIKNLMDENRAGVLSTSGNAGIAAGYYASKHGAQVYVITSDKCETAKLTALSKQCKLLFLSKNPARICNYITAKYGFKNLRPSIDTLAAEGFENLGYEIHEQFLSLQDGGKIGAFWKEIYVFVTSGASYTGLFAAFEKLRKKGLIRAIPRMHRIIGFAGKLGVKNSQRENEMVEILEKTGGMKIEVTESDLLKFKGEFPNLSLSDESLSSLSAALKYGADKNSLVISTGKKWLSENRAFDKKNIPRLDNLEDCDKLFT